MLRTTIGTLLTSLVLVLAGCASSTGRVAYPNAWASIKSSPTDDGCPRLAGTYSNQSAATFPEEIGDLPKLSDVFTHLGQGHGPTSPSASKSSWPIISPNALSVSIDQTPETMTVTFVSADGDGTSLNFRRYHFKLSEKRFDDLFTCYLSAGEPRLRFMAEPEGHVATFPMLYVEGGGTLVFLLKAADGSLIVQWRSDSVALSAVLIGSGYSVDSIWYRYPNSDQH